MILPVGRAVTLICLRHGEGAASCYHRVTSHQPTPYQEILSYGAIILKRVSTFNVFLRTAMGWTCGRQDRNFEIYFVCLHIKEIKLVVIKLHV
jgi:hypothetical protein